MAFFVSRMHSIETVTPVHNLLHHQPSLRYTELFIVRYNSKIKPILRKRMRLNSQVFRFRFRQPTIRGVTKAQPKAAVFKTFYLLVLLLTALVFVLRLSPQTEQTRINAIQAYLLVMLTHA